MSPPSSARRLFDALAELPGLLALLAVLLLLAETVAPRLSYPFDLEWMEGGMLVHALRLQQGLPLYTEPSAEWIPYIYPPLYPALIAAAAGILPQDVLPLDYALARGISLLGTGLGALSLALLLRRAGGGLGLCAGVAAAFLSTYDESGAFFDLVRADGLLIALIGGSLLALQRRHLGLAGALLVLAFLTKHSFALLGLPMLAWVARTQGRAGALRFALSSVLPALLATGALQLWSEGWFLVYLLEVPASHGMVGPRALEAPLELVQALPVLAAAGVLAAILLRWRAPAGTPGSERWLFGPFLLVLLVLVVLMRAHVGGYLNVLIPGFWGLALGSGLLLARLSQRLPRPSLSAGIGLLCLLQVGLGRWEPAIYQPPPADREAGEALLERIRAVEGEVFMPHAPWYPHLAGKQPSLPLIALMDLDHGGRMADYLPRIDEAIAAQRWQLIVLANTDFGHGIDEHYRRSERIRFTGRALMPKTGWQARPREIYLPRPR